MRSLQQNSCHQNAAKRGPQTLKVVFDVTCSSATSAYIFCPPTTQELSKKHHETGSSEQLLTYAMTQIEYGNTRHWQDCKEGLLVPTNYAKDILGNLIRGMRLAW